MLSYQEILEELSVKLNTWKLKYGVKRIGVFSSHVHEEQKETSDIDLLVEFNDSHLSFDNYMELKFELGEHFQKSIDLVLIDDIKPALKPSILGSAKFVTCI